MFILECLFVKVFSDSEEEDLADNDIYADDSELLTEEQLSKMSFDDLKAMR